jgi:hypothetical protein
LREFGRWRASLTTEIFDRMGKKICEAFADQREKILNRSRRIGHLSQGQFAP